jgi:Fe2+ or Zn2+ uptake regulation protein
MQIKNGAFYTIVKNYLETSHKLANFEDLMNLFKEKKPNKTTLYRILTRLETANLLRIIPTISGNKFESNTKPNHLHQICRQCQGTFCTKILLEPNISTLEKVVCKECLKT